MRGGCFVRSSIAGISLARFGHPPLPWEVDILTRTDECFAELAEWKLGKVQRANEPPQRTNSVKL